MRVTSSRAFARPAPVPKMPLGLMELMDGLARDVLMHNPSNVYEFCANHMEKLLEIRDGPSSKKSLTLEQKIQKAQEKIRERAQQRRERFDNELKQRTKDDAHSEDNERGITILPENPPSPRPSLKIPIHQEVNLKNASELEIAHVPPVDNKLLREMYDVSSNEGLASIKEDDQSVISNNMLEKETSCSEEKHGQQSHKLLDDEPIFGKVEIEAIDTIETLKGPEDIVDMVAIDSPLQTITETSEENFINDSGMILPKITIGDEHDEHDLNSNSKEELGTSQECQPENIIESGNKDTSECSSTNLPEMESKLQEIKSNDNQDNDVIKNETTISDSAPVQESTDFVETNNKDIGDVISTNTEIINDHTDKVSETKEITKSGATIDTANTKSDDPNVQMNSKDAKTLDDDTLNIKTEMSELPNADTTDELSHKENTTEEQQNIPAVESSNTPLKEASNHTRIEVGTNVEPINDTITENKVTISNDETNLKPENDIETVNTTAIKNDADVKVNSDIENINMTIENEANQKPEPDVESVNDSKIESILEKISETVPAETQNDVSSKINDAIKSEVMHHSLKENEENLENEFDKLQENTEISLQKSDSTENTNEDSMSIIESDFSKTDDDSTQNNPNMDLETAAVTIQKVFRSFMFKSRNSTFEDNANDEHNSVDEDNDKKEEYYAAANLSKERRPLGITRMDTVLQTVNEEKSLSLSTDDSSTLSSAATTIQAHVRGFLVRNKLNSSKTFSMNSLVNSHEVFESDPEQHKNKTILNIHIVPEKSNYLSRDESLITSMDLSLDGSPPSSVNLHPMSCDITERRKMLKREDAVQSVTPPSNNSGKLSEDSVKEVLINENGVLQREATDDKTTEIDDQLDTEVGDVVSSASTVTPTTVIAISKSEDPIRSSRDNTEETLQRNGRSFTKLSSDESDVITPYVPSPRSSDDDSKLVHSGEFHDVVLPTKVIRNDTSAVREFKNVLVYFLLWNNS